MILAGTILTYCGIAFLVLGLLAAAKEVLQTKPHDAGQGTAESPIGDVTNLVETIGKLRNWIALAVIGLLMICLGSFLAGGLPVDKLVSENVHRTSQP